MRITVINRNETKLKYFCIFSHEYKAERKIQWLIITLSTDPFGFSGDLCISQATFLYLPIFSNAVYTRKFYKLSYTLDPTSLEDFR